MTYRGAVTILFISSVMYVAVNIPLFLISQHLVVSVFISCSIAFIFRSCGLALTNLTVIVVLLPLIISLYTRSRPLSFSLALSLFLFLFRNLSRSLFLSIALSYSLSLFLALTLSNFLFSLSLSLSLSLSFSLSFLPPSPLFCIHVINVKKSCKQRHTDHKTYAQRIKEQSFVVSRLHQH